MSNDNEQVPNGRLREYATGHAFVMTMQKTHVAMLDAVAHGDRDRATGRMGRLWVTGVNGLIERGLVEHRYKPDFLERMQTPYLGPITDTYRLTRAGWLMHDLLAEAGLVIAVTSKKQRRLIAA